MMTLLELLWAFGWVHCCVIPISVNIVGLRLIARQPMALVADTCSEGRHHRHAELNQIIYRSLISARIPSRLEPSDIYRSDGVTIVPWERGKALVWDATCPDTLASSYSVRASSTCSFLRL